MTDEDKKGLGVTLNIFEPMEGGFENPKVREKLGIEDEIFEKTTDQKPRNKKSKDENISDKKPSDKKPTDEKPRDEKAIRDEEEAIKEFLSSKGKGKGPPEVTIVPRSEWSKIELPEKLFRYTEPVKFVLMTHTGTSSCSKKEDCIRILRTIQRTHIALGYADIVYNFLIGGDGLVYEGRGWTWESAWIPKYQETDDRRCLKVAHIGYYGDFSKKAVEAKPFKLLLDLLENGMYKNHVMWNATMISDYNQPKDIPIDI
ncbi:peptidoglycan-recognition protein LE-like [Macrosteles quadrilineatus]|uniref:peptidoglycan-recognition protein LE-like n=1 Tax=Macrosteles quadrilineatus TaxID=74068 RepID=UPI0023E32BA1|nr:peptidoglycan-recognition protein LE-like [Macrosteles quadrilineatus]